MLPFAVLLAGAGGLRLALFLLILVVLAGFVAAAGDRMGRLAARRKIRVGNIRPRHVSTGIAVLTGVVIAAVSFGILFLLWNDFRDALSRYDQLRDDLATAQVELSQQRTKLARASSEAAEAEERLVEMEQQVASNQAALDQATELRHAAEDALADAEDTLAAAQAELAGAQAELSASREALSRNEELVARQAGELQELLERRAELEGEVSTLESEVSALEEDVEILSRIFSSSLDMAKEEMQIWEEGEIVYHRGTILFYVEIPADRRNDTRQLINRAVEGFMSELEQMDVSLEDVSPAELDRAEAAVAAADGAAVVVVAAARNAVSGGELGLVMETVPLDVLVGTGEQFMTVLVRDTEASINWRGELVETTAVPREFDAASYTDFSLKLWRIFNQQAAGMGFLPDMETGTIPNPLEAMPGAFSEVAGRERPFMIQFVSEQDATAIDGLADCGIYISQWPPVPVGSSGAGEDS